MAPVLGMLTIDPPAPAAMREPTSDMRRNGALKLRATTLSKSASGVSSEDGASGKNHLSAEPPASARHEHRLPGEIEERVTRHGFPSSPNDSRFPWRGVMEHVGPPLEPETARQQRHRPIQSVARIRYPGA